MTMESILSLLGLARKAGRVVCGEEAVSEAAVDKKIRLLLYAEDAASNSCRRALNFAAKGACLALQIPCGKADLGRAVGYAECAMLGVTDIGFAGAIGKKLSAMTETESPSFLFRINGGISIPPVEAPARITIPRPTPIKGPAQIVPKRGSSVKYLNASTL